MADRRTVRDATHDALRASGMTRIFANPGSTEVPFLVDLPSDLDFVLALHEASVVGLATGQALATGRPTLALLHTTAGLGNAVAAIATARVNRAPVVVLVGQQDRRHLALEPFLAGRLAGLAGDYPLETVQPALAADVPAAVRRAAHLAGAGRGPVLVVVPMDDWDAPATEEPEAAAGSFVVAPREAADTGALLEALRDSRAPAVLAGAGMDTERGWAALQALADAAGAVVWTEPFGARAGFDQTHPRYAGQLPSGRAALRAALARYDLLLVLGTAAVRQYGYEPGALVPDAMPVLVVSDDPAEVARSAADLGVLADPVGTACALAEALGPGTPLAPAATTAAVPREGPLVPEDVFALLAEHLPADTVLVEESPSSRPALQAMVPARAPMGFLSAAMGGLGFALPVAIGLRMGGDRPVVAVLGDGSAMYAVQALWTAAHRSVGVLVVVLANGGYRVMDQLAARRGGAAPWPSFPELSVATVAEGLGVSAERVADRAALAARLPELCRDLAGRSEPLLLEIVVPPTPPLEAEESP